MPNSIISFPDRSKRAILCAVDTPPRSKRAASKLRRAAELVESTAFEEAGEHPTSVISQLIMLSADLTRLARVIEKATAED